MEVPSVEDVRALLKSADPSFRAAVGLGAFAGLRIGEANGVQLTDIDFLRRTLHVERQVQRRAPGPVEVRAPKYGSERTIHLPDGLLQMLSTHLEEVGVYGSDEWLIPGRNDGPMWPRSMDYQWNKTRDAAGLSTKFHSLRHFYASGLIAAGCDVVTVQRALGHRSASITLNVYSHLWRSAEDRTRKAAQGLMDEVMSDPADSVRTAAQLPRAD
ncbi:site-specific integrase [Kocuria sp. CPCC 205231]|uniref:tyrosine-type recombinase/integrase n=1 Tax=Kocuria sp. CPCC 205231 TaxID=3073551 RepID=UPI0034D69350